MTTTTTTATSTAPPPAPVRHGSARLHRLAALGRAELTLLARNRVALFSALTLPTGLLWVLHKVEPQHYGAHVSAPSPARALAGGSIGIVLLFVVYTTLVPAYVGRREELVLKRLRSGQLRDLEILGGTALPTLAIAVVQCVLVIALAGTVVGVGGPENLPLLVLAVAVGMVVTVLLAALTAIWTPTTEMAQLTTAPLLLVSMASAGLAFPLAGMPAAFQDACRFLPLTPVLELVRLAWFGSPDGPGRPLGILAGFSEALPYLGVSLLWGLLIVYVLKRRFRWEPRR